MNKEQEEVVKDLLATALEGGSNYWYYLPNKLPKREGKTFDEAILEFLKEGGSIQVNDWENNEEKLGELTWESVERAFVLMKENYKHLYLDLVDDNWDADVADAWFQLAVMGEVTFG
jgi:hypothetical protein